MKQEEARRKFLVMVGWNPYKNFLSAQNRNNGGVGLKDREKMSRGEEERSGRGRQNRPPCVSGVILLQSNFHTGDRDKPISRKLSITRE